MAEKHTEYKSICETYPGVRMLNGCAMDAASYERHTKAQANRQEPTPVIQPTAPQPQDPFAQQQDFRAIATKAFEADRTAIQPQSTDSPAVEYRPTAAQYVTQEQRTVLVEQQTVACEQVICYGSGSYFTSGSYLLTSGSYVTSGSYFTSSGSYLISSGSYNYHSDRQLLGGYGLDLIK
jgi:hypothetical protein